MKVLLLTLTTILVVTSDQEFDEAYYKLLPPNYSYGYIQSTTSEKFSQRQSLPECAIVALNSQSEFFTYDKVSHICKNYSPKNIMKVVSTNDNNEVSFYRKSTWIKVYTLSMGAGSKVAKSFLNEGDPSTWKVKECTGTFCPNFFRHPILDFWNHLPIDEVKLVVYKNQTDVMNMVFDGRNTTLESWFSLEKLKSSPWSDLPGKPVIHFSLGRYWGRKFYVSSLHSGCIFDSGWIVVIEKPYCGWEKTFNYPIILYSWKNSSITWNNGFAIADSMAIFIRLK